MIFKYTCVLNVYLGIKRPNLLPSLRLQAQDFGVVSKTEGMYGLTGHRRSSATKRHVLRTVEGLRGRRFGRSRLSHGPKAQLKQQAKSKLPRGGQTFITSKYYKMLDQCQILQ